MTTPEQQVSAPSTEMPRVRGSRSLGASRFAIGRTASSIGLVVASLVAFGCLWQLMSAYFGSDIFPSPLSVLSEDVKMMRDGTLTSAAAVSLRRIALGFCIGSAISVVLSVLIGFVSPIRAAVNPPLQLVRFLSSTAMIPVALIWFGIGEGSKIFIVAWATLIMSIMTMIQGVEGTPTVRVRAAQCLGTSGIDVLWRIVLPSVVPFIVGALRTALAAAFMAVVAAEMLGASSGLGYLLLQYGQALDTTRTFAVLAAFCLLGFICDALYVRATKTLLWRFLHDR